ncbi:hypothetical protein C8A03DRAFT_35703 [Achaetomium macrosporum]|uniref:BHLH domain-containing protein n=1 Tax=Achaetomium macrosporum TaxID=79813 RepID=A0AAN7C7F2_9PEZI|nr:hypothetical protein C8A03DRAFT_35703 [Achaetomium macrosporum]
MAASVGVPHPDLPEAPTTPGQKRKRASESASPDSRRSKRGAPAAPATAMSVPESDSQTFLGDTVSIAQAAHDHVSVDDFSALAQAAVSDHNDATDTSNASNTAAAALNMYPSLHVPQSTEETFANQATPESHHSENSFNNHAVSQPPPDGLPLPPPPAPAQQTPNGAQQEQRYSATPNPKPAVGSEEWHKMRKDNHKEVERRRRETINEGINELAKIVPGCEKNKGSILQRAVAFITQLKENEQQNIEKWTLEKLLTEQAIAELSSSNDKLKQECERLYRELDTWKQIAQSAGLHPPQEKEEPGSSS